MACSVLLLGVAYLGGACRNNDQPPEPPVSPTVETDAKPPPATPIAASEALPPAPDDPTRWLFAEAPTDSAKGGWIEGSFDPQKNRIDIRTRDTARFSLDTSRIPIDWDKLVVIQIDGKGSELKHRDNPLVHFEHDGLGHWKVAD